MKTIVLLFIFFPIKTLAYPTEYICSVVGHFLDSHQKVPVQLWDIPMRAGQTIERFQAESISPLATGPKFLNYKWILHMGEDPAYEEVFLTLSESLTGLKVCTGSAELGNKSVGCRGETILALCLSK